MKQLFIGLDVHKKTWAVAIQEDHLIVKRFTIEADADLLIGYVTRQVATKSDKVDSAHLARELQAGRLKGIYVPTHKQEQFRSLFRRRNDLVKSLRRIKCHIKSMLLYYGIVLPEKYDNLNWSKDMIQWVYKQRWSYAPATEAMKSRLEEYLFLRKQYLHVGNELRSYARKHFTKDYYLLRSVPGIGPLTAIAMLAEAGDIRRFRNIDYLSSYVGLVPSVYSSGENPIAVALPIEANDF